MKNNRIGCLLPLFILLFLSACSPGHTKKMDPELKFLMATAPTLSGEEAPLADTLFRRSVLRKEGTETLYVYVGNPGCSVCISKALDCYRCYLASGATPPFQFILKSEDTAVFDYYMMKSGMDKPVIEKNYYCADLQDALYTISGNRVVSVTRW